MFAHSNMVYIITDDLYTNIVSSNYSYLIIIYLPIVVWFQVFLFNTDNLQAIRWFQVTNDNTLKTIRDSNNYT